MLGDRAAVRRAALMALNVALQRRAGRRRRAASAMPAAVAAPATPDARGRDHRSTARPRCSMSSSGPIRRRAGPGARSTWRACGVNFADTLARIGLYADAPKPPMVVGYEVAGTIASVGEGVDAVARRRARHGGHAVRRLRVERVAVAADDALPLADWLSFEQGAAIPVNYATAWAGARQVRLAGGGGEGPDPGGGRRRRDRGDADREALRRRGLGTASPSSTTRSCATASTTPSTTAPTGGGRACRRSI